MTRERGRMRIEKKEEEQERESRRAIVYFLILNQSEYNHINRHREASSRVF